MHVALAIYGKAMSVALRDVTTSQPIAELYANDRPVTSAGGLWEGFVVCFFGSRAFVEKTLAVVEITGVLSNI